MRAEEREIKKQMEFIMELTKRLSHDVEIHPHKIYFGYERIKNDAVRIRRELNILCKMTKWDWKERDLEDQK